VDGACSTHGIDEKCIRVTVRKPDSNGPRGKHVVCYVGNAHVKETECGVDSSGLRLGSV